MKCLLIFFYFLIFDVSASDSLDLKYKIHWGSRNKSFSAIATIHEDKMVGSHDIDETNIVVTALNNTNGKQLWLLKDGVPDCHLNHRLSFLSEYFESIDLFNNDDPVILFAYKIGCTGDIAPVEVKYIAFYKGTQYSLYGSELLVIGGIASFNYGNLEPRPDNKLKEQPVILKYMLKKWAEVSLTNMDNS